MTESRILHDTVIKNGFCIGCGACASQPNSPFKMKMDELGNFVAYSNDNLDDNITEVLKICPFSGKSKNENEIADEFFVEIEKRDTKIGKYIACFAGHVTENDFREKGSSGGMGKWIGYKLLKEKKIDYFIQLTPNQTGKPDELLFDYGIFSNAEDVIKGSKSSYYPVTLINIIEKIKRVEGRYAITGVPCFIKTIRLLSLHDNLLRQRIKFTIGVICGGMKSANQSKMIGWELGVNPKNLIGIDFRRKYKDRPPTQKIYQVWSNTDNTERYKNAGEIFGTDYGAGFFKPLACDYCDDVVGETADISIGDAWLPAFKNDPGGSSLVIVRNRELLELIDVAIKENHLKLSNITAEEVADSQAGGFRHRREGLSFRIGKLEQDKKWYPKKRVAPNEFIISEERKKIYLLREEIAAKSHTSFYRALQENNLHLFHNEMNPLVKSYFKSKKDFVLVDLIKRFLFKIFKTRIKLLQLV